MDSAIALQKYVQEQLQIGLNHQQITSQLLASGWSIEQLQDFAPYLFSNNPGLAPSQTSAQPHIIQPQPQVSQLSQSQIGQVGIQQQQVGVADPGTLPQIEQSTQPDSSQTTMLPYQDKKRRVLFRRLLISALVVAFLIIGLAGLFVMLRMSTSSSKSFKDPNFSMQLPSGWRTDRGYEAGKTLVIAYSPENTDSAKKDQSAQLTVYVGIGYDRAEELLAYLKDSKIEFTSIRDESFDVDGVQYRLVEYTTRQSSEDTKTHTLMVNAKRGDFLINADIVAPDEHWQLHAEEADQIMRSIMPGCDNINDKNEVFKDVSMLCS